MSDTYDIDQPIPIVKHLIELRFCLLKSVLAVLLIFGGLYYFSNDLYQIISEPLR